MKRGDGIIENWMIVLRIRFRTFPFKSKFESSTNIREEIFLLFMFYPAFEKDKRDFPIFI